jgi:hypothetical protein
MAGSGQIRRVYASETEADIWPQGREVWMKPQPWDIDLRMFDLIPRGPYAALIGQHDLLTGFPPVERAPDGEQLHHLGNA